MDPVVFRRFDLKLRFLPLREDQKLALFGHLIEIDAGPNPGRIAGRLASMKQLTPGDVRAALRSLRIQGRPLEADALLEALEQEYSFKTDGARSPIGFVWKT
jgi:hypothetical protein